MLRCARLRNRKCPLFLLQGCCFRNAAELPEPHSFSPLEILTGTAGGTRPLSGDCLSQLSPPSISRLSLLSVESSVISFSVDLLPSLRGPLLLPVFITPLIGWPTVTSLSTSETRFRVCPESSPCNLRTLLNFICRAFGSIRLK